LRNEFSVKIAHTIDNSLTFDDRHPLMIKTLLLSNSTMPGTLFFTWPKPFVKTFLADTTKGLVFIPFAGVTISFDEYFSKVREAFKEIGFGIESIHEKSDKLEAVERATAIVVGGGNSFALLSRVYQENILEPIRKKVLEGTPYIGWSAGANLACPTIMTTNDMPIVSPPSLNALNLIPFQINPHYHELKFENQGGETRRERLEEFLVMNKEKRVLGLPEGMLVERNGSNLWLKGQGTARLYEYQKPVVDLDSRDDMTFLMR
jgi:dipeptidase E